MPESGGSFGDPEVFKVRQAFYKGVGRCCLRDLWDQLNEIRESRVTTRLFRKKQKPVTGIPYLTIANLLGRDQSEIGRWFRGESPYWENLIMAMTVLGVEWGNFGYFGTKVRKLSHELP